MKRFSVGLIVGIILALLVGTVGFAIADQPIKLIINGKEIVCDVAPQNINGRVLVPARFVAENLGATVTWDQNNNAVVVTGQDYAPRQTGSVEILRDYYPDSPFPCIRYNETVYVPMASGLEHFGVSKNVANYDKNNNTITFNINGNQKIFIIGNIEENTDDDVIFYGLYTMIKEATLKSLIGK